MKGHTKNLCDRMYNFLKGKYCSKNIWTTEQLDDTLRSCDLVNVVIMPKDRFKNFESFLWNHYLEPDHVTSYHLFEFVFSENVTEYQCKVFRDSDEWITFDLMPGKRTHRSSRKLSIFERKTSLAEMYPTLKVEPTPRLPDINECDFFSVETPLPS